MRSGRDRECVGIGNVGEYLVPGAGVVLNLSSITYRALA